MATVWLAAALSAGCQADPRYGPDGELLEACDVTEEEQAAWAACRAARSPSACADRGGSWRSDDAAEFACFCPPPNSGCPCRDHDDCDQGSCITDDPNGGCDTALGSCETPSGCWCDVETGGTVCE